MMVKRSVGNFSFVLKYIYKCALNKKPTVNITKIQTHKKVGLRENYMSLNHDKLKKNCLA